MLFFPISINILQVKNINTCITLLKNKLQLYELIYLRMYIMNIFKIS